MTLASPAEAAKLLGITPRAETIRAMIEAHQDAVSMRFSVFLAFVNFVASAACYACASSRSTI